MEVKCLKTKFATKKDADFHIDRLLKRLPRHSYLCPTCNIWHLTKKSQGKKSNTIELQEIKRLKLLLESQESIIKQSNRVILDNAKEVELVGNLRKEKTERIFHIGVLENRIHELKGTIKNLKERYKISL